MIERTTARLLAENRALRVRVRKLERAQARRSAAGAPARHSGRFRTLAEVSVLINAPLSLDDVLRVVTEEARRIIGAHHAVVSARVDGDRVVEVVSLSEKYAPGRGAAVPDASAIGRLVSEAKRPVRLTRAELATHPGWRTVAAVRDGRPPFRGVLAAPLTARDGTSIGFIQFSDRYRGEFTVEDAAVLLLLAQTASVALENARLYADATRRRVDWMMPELDGLEVCRRVRGAGAASPPYLLLLTARGRPEDIVTGLEAGADDYLSKPFDAAELRARVAVGARVVELRQSLADRVRALEDALARVRQLQGLLPICAWCKKIRNDQNFWQRVETYIGEHTDARFTHGICPDCHEKVLQEIHAARARGELGG